MRRPRNQLQIGLKILAAVSLAVVAVMSFRGGRISAQDMPSLVGRIEGDDVEVVTTTPAGVETNAAPTVVASGSEVTLRSGHALLLLNSGGTISVCGPAHFKIVKSANAITLALDYGRVHPELDSAGNIHDLYANDHCHAGRDSGNLARSDRGPRTGRRDVRSSRNAAQCELNLNSRIRVCLFRKAAWQPWPGARSNH